MGTARLVDRLGLPEYFAMEAYVVRRNGQPLESERVPTSAMQVTPQPARPTRTPAPPRESPVAAPPLTELVGAGS